MKKSNRIFGFISIVIAALILLYTLMEHRKWINHMEIREGALMMENTNLKDQNIRLRRISLKLYQYSDPKKVKKDSSLTKDMIHYTSNY